MTTSEDPSVQRANWLAERSDRIAERTHDAFREDAKRRNESTVASGNLAVRSLMLINGGAAVSVLAFIGGLVSQGKVGVPQLRDVASSLMWFAWGVVAAVGSMGFAYLSNYAASVFYNARKFSYDEPHVTNDPAKSAWFTAAVATQLIAIAAGLIALVLFVLGMIDVKHSIGNLPSSAQTTSTPAGGGWRLTIQTDRLK